MSKKKKNKKKKKFSFKEFFTSVKFLSFIFIILLMLVVFLSVLVFNKKGEDGKEIKSDISIPLIKYDDELGFSVNALALSGIDKYVFKVTNYKDNKVIDKDITYNITIENGSNSKIEVLKEGDKDNLMVNQKSTIIENEVMPSKNKFYTYYIIKMKSHGKLTSQDLINVKINTLSKK